MYDRWILRVNARAIVRLGSYTSQSRLRLRPKSAVTPGVVASWQPKPGCEMCRRSRHIVAHSSSLSPFSKRMGWDSGSACGSTSRLVRRRRGVNPGIDQATVDESIPSTR